MAMALYKTYTYFYYLRRMKKVMRLPLSVRPFVCQVTQKVTGGF